MIMTQDEKDLLLKDLCAKLPYGVKYMDILNPDEYPSTLQYINNYGFVMDDDGFSHEIENIKPYLFPLSSMTEEQIKEYEDALVYHDYVGGGWTMAKTFDDEYVVPYWFVDFCNKHHLDYKGLIPKGLAIDCTNLNIY